MVGFRPCILALALAGLTACATAERAVPGPSDGAAPSAARGEVLVRRHCGGCHAAGVSGASHLAAAPPLRELHKRYEPEVLGEALAEGILTGHPAMPQFRFSPPDIRSVIIYLNAIQTRQAS